MGSVTARTWSRTGRMTTHLVLLRDGGHLVDVDAHEDDVLELGGEPVKDGRDGCGETLGQRGASSRAEE